MGGTVSNSENGKLSRSIVCLNLNLAPLMFLWSEEEVSAYETKFFISLFERAFKVMKNGVYFIVIALLVAELFKILVYAN